MGHVYTIEKLPGNWDDNLLWGDKDLVTHRHIAAFAQALAERKTLSRGYASEYVNDIISCYSPKNFSSLLSVCSLIKKELTDIISEEREYSSRDLFRSSSLYSSGYGYVCQNFSNRHNVIDIDYDNKCIWYPADSEISPGALGAMMRPELGYYPPTLNDLVSEKLGKIPDFAEFRRGDDIRLTNAKLMRWLREMKTHVSSLCRKVVPDIWTVGKRAKAYYGIHQDRHLDNVIREEEHPDVEEEEVNRTFVGRISCSYHGFPPEDDTPVWSYSCSSDMVPLKFKNCGTISFELSTFVYETAEEWIYEDPEDRNSDIIATNELHDFESFGTPFRERGWHNFGIIKPNEEVTIIPNTFADKSIVANYYKAYTQYRGYYYREYDLRYNMLMLSFNTDDGFRF